MKKQDKNKLRLWQDRLKTNEAAYDGETSRMDEREALYAGTNEMRPIVQGERKTKAVHVRNICAEIIEAQTDSNIPQPKVTARRKQDEMKAKLIEDMLRNELDRMPFEQLNDIMERTVPISSTIPVNILHLTFNQQIFSKMADFFYLQMDRFGRVCNALTFHRCFRLRAAKELRCHIGMHLPHDSAFKCSPV